MENPGSNEILKLVEEYGVVEPEMLREIRALTKKQLQFDAMISGWEVLRFLRFLVTLKSPKNLLELGMFTGYTTAGLGLDLLPNQRLTAVERNKRYIDLAKPQLQSLPSWGQIQIVEQDCLLFLEESVARYDFVYVDADKKNYPIYYELLKKRAYPEALLIFDNIFWRGRLHDVTDKKARAIQRLLKKVASDKDVRSSLVPIRDGLLVVQFDF